jgi:hypothetical protein
MWARGWSRLHLSAVGALVGFFLLQATPAQALVITLDDGNSSITITDNGPGDNNSLSGIIDFNQSFADYKVFGTLDTVAGPTVTSLIGSPSASLRLTNFTAEAINVPSKNFKIQMSDQLTGIYTGIQGADALDAYVAHSSGSAIPANTDQLIDWQGYVSGLAFTPAFGTLGGNPLLPASSSPVQYPAFGHGPTPFFMVLVNPVLGANLEFYLGAVGNQLLLPTSANLGFTVVPEPATLGMGMLGAAAVLAGSWRRQRSRR